jgi:hypothetical protein
MVERRDGFGFTLEAFAELRGGNFDRDVAIQTRVSGAIYLTHATGTYWRKNLLRNYIPLSGGQVRYAAGSVSRGTS